MYCRCTCYLIINLAYAYQDITIIFVATNNSDNNVTTTCNNNGATTAGITVEQL